MARNQLGGLGLLAAAAAGAYLLLRESGPQTPQTGAQDDAITTPHDEGTPDDTPPGVSEELNESVTTGAEDAWSGAKEFIPDDSDNSGTTEPTSAVGQAAVEAGGGPTPTIPDDPVIDDTWGDPTPTADEDPADAGGVDGGAGGGVGGSTTAFEDTVAAISDPTTNVGGTVQPEPDPEPEPTTALEDTRDAISSGAFEEVRF